MRPVNLSTALASAVILCLASAAQADDAILKDVPAPTLALYHRYLAEYTTPQKSDPRLVTDLEAAPGGDLCFLDVALRKEGDWPRITARSEVVKLKTEATFTTLKGLLFSETAYRPEVIELIGQFGKPEILPQLLEIAAKDPGEFPRDSAVRVLSLFNDPRVEAALMAALQDPIPMIRDHARAGLAGLKSAAAFPRIVAALESSASDVREGAITNVAAYHDKAAVRVLLQEYQRQTAGTDDWSQRLAEWTHYRLRDCLKGAMPVLGPFPDQRLSEWQEYWARAEPLLSDDLQLKALATPNKAVAYRDEDFARTTDDVHLAAALNAATFRVGDPMRLTLTLKNAGPQPASLVMPHMPSGWYPTMAFGIVLKRSGEKVLEIVPSEFYLGSYSGPPGFQTLGPGETNTNSICMQSWLQGRIDSPLPEGEYELAVSFDSSKFAMMQPKGVQLVHRWDAAVVKFTVKGAAETDPRKVLDAIGALQGNKFLFEDLTSPNIERRDPAWRVVVEYGDSRMSPLINKIVQENGNRVNPNYRSPDMLRHYEEKARVPLELQ